MFFPFQIIDLKMEYECKCFIPPPLRRGRRLIILGPKNEKELAKIIQNAIEADERQKVESKAQLENVNVNKCNKTNKLKIILIEYFINTSRFDFFIPKR